MKKEEKNSIEEEIVETAEKYADILKRAKEKCKVQMKAVKEKLKKYVRNEAEYEFLSNMVEHLVKISTSVARDEQILRLETENVERLHKQINSAMATKLQVYISYIGKETKKSND